MSFTSKARAGLLAMGIVAIATPGLAQSSAPAGSGGPSNPATGSQANEQAGPGTAATGGTYAPGSSSGSVSGSSSMSPSGTTGAAPGQRDAPSSQTPNPPPKGNVGGN